MFDYAHVPLRFIDRSCRSHKNKISVVSIVQAAAVHLSAVTSAESRRTEAAPSPEEVTEVTEVTLQTGRQQFDTRQREY